MFVSITSSSSTLRPDDSKIQPHDWSILSKFWYPLAIEHDVQKKPVGVKLLDVDLVLYRASGQVTVALDRCPHRWIKLSGGTLTEDRLTCRFHGLSFDAGGQCVHVPALGSEARLPPSYRVRTFRNIVRYGMVWACLDDTAETDIPAFPALAGRHDSALMFNNVCEWPMSAARQIENFIDLAHLPWVHATTLGGDPHGRIQPSRVEQRDKSIQLRARVTETVPFGGTPTECELSYEVFLPFAVDFGSRPVGGTGFQSVNIASPTTAHACRVFQIIPRGAPGEVFDEGPIGIGDPDGSPGVINQQDIDVHMLLSEHDLPLNEKFEIHLPVDSAGISYRKRLVGLGLGLGC